MKQKTILKFSQNAKLMMYQAIFFRVEEIGSKIESI